MKRILHRITAAVLLASYGLAVTVSGAFHTHHRGIGESYAASGTECLDGFECDTRDHFSAKCGLHNVLAAHRPPNEALSPVVSVPAETCSVCSFLAQKPILTTAADEVRCLPLTQMRTWPKAIARIEESFSPLCSRGPPPLA